MIKQVSVFVENKPGRLSGVTRALFNENINIYALSVADTTDFGLVRLIVNDAERAAGALKENGFSIKTTSVCACAMEHKPGGLCALLEVLDKFGASIEYMYAFANAGTRFGAVVVFCLTEKEMYEKLKDSGLFFLTDDDVINGSF